MLAGVNWSRSSQVNLRGFRHGFQPAEQPEMVTSCPTEKSLASSGTKFNSSVVKISCPSCKSKLEVDAIGDFVSCPSCSAEFNVEESQKVKSLIEKTYNPPVLDNPPTLDTKPVLNKVSKPSSVLTMPVRTNEPNYVIVTDIRMQFFSMVEFMIMWVFASIPALIILGFVFGVAGLFLGAFGQK